MGGRPASAKCNVQNTPSNMNATPKNHDQWRPCLPGELRRMVDHVKARRRREFVKQLAGAGAALVLIGTGGYLAGQWLQRPTEYHFGGIACGEVMRLLPDYRANKLDVGQHKQISTHLEKCPNCGSMHRHVVPGTAGGTHVLRGDGQESSSHGRTAPS